jgi:hypothetical protein
VVVLEPSYLVASPSLVGVYSDWVLARVILSILHLFHPCRYVRVLMPGTQCATEASTGGVGCLRVSEEVGAGGGDREPEGRLRGMNG